MSMRSNPAYAWRAKASVSSPEWYTPTHIIEAARAAMQGIELDVASCAQANCVVRASRFYCADDDALRQHWVAETVWMNPPYGHGYVLPFMDKLRLHLDQGDIHKATVLVRSGSDTRWFQNHATATTGIVMLVGRLKFWRPDNTTGTPISPSMALFFGVPEADIVRHFGHLGTVLQVVR